MTHDDTPVLVITADTADELSLRLAAAQLYAAGAALVEFAALDDASPAALVAQNAGRYAAVYHLDAFDALALCTGRAPDGRGAVPYITVIARPENFCDLLRAQKRRRHAARVDGLRLASGRNEWIEAGFAACQLAQCPCPGERMLVLLPGKNYRLEDDTELFAAVLANGCRVLASDLRCYYFLRGRIRWEETNFTRRQLDEVAKLPAPVTPAYRHGNGDMTLTLPYAPERRGGLRYREQTVQSLWRQGAADGEGGYFTRAACPLADAQPGDALHFVAELPQAA